MVWSQFSIKILRVHFVNFVLDNSNLDKISYSLTKKSVFWIECNSLWDEKNLKKKKRKKL